MPPIATRSESRLASCAFELKLSSSLAKSCKTRARADSVAQEGAVYAQCDGCQIRLQNRTVDCKLPVHALR